MAFELFDCEELDLLSSYQEFIRYMIFDNKMGESSRRKVCMVPGGQNTVVPAM